MIGGREQAEPDLEAAVALAEEAIASGMRRSEAVRQVAVRTGVGRRALYARVAEEEREGPGDGD